MSGHEPSRRARRRRERELRRAANQLDRLDARYGVGTRQPGAALETDPPRRRSVPAGLAGLLVTGLLLTGVVLVTPGDGFDTVRRLFGFSSGRLGDVPDYEPGTGTYTFMFTQRGSDEPVGYDPCRPIEYGVNPDGAPDDWEALIDTAVARTETATGLRFEYVGTTDERPFDPTTQDLPSVTRRPVIIGFADEDELKELAGAVAGLGGSVGVRGSLGRDYLVTGSIALDTDVFQDGWLGRSRQDLQPIVDHEFGHLVGLGHVKDRGELMARRNTGQITYGPGDLEGLALLGSIPCA